MHNTSKLLSLLLILATFASCAVAPLNSTHTARSLGADQNQLKVNVGVPGVMYERGLNADWDIGAGIEVQTELVLNAFGKYAFLNNPGDGFSIAGLGGVGLASDTKSVYGGPVFSYRHDWFEVFTVTRLNYVSWKNRLSVDDRNDLLSFIPEKATFFYTQVDVGVSYISDKSSVTVGAKMFSLEKDNSSASPFVDIGFKF